jgi:chlorite dismutase
MTIKKGNLISFSGGNQGQWIVRSMKTLSGNAIEPVSRIEITKESQLPADAKWTFNAFISNLRYTTRKEKTELDQGSKPLGIESNNYAALIPIKKSDEWWKMTQDERRKIFEEDSRHIALSLDYLPFISRQLHHCRDLGEHFDFLTWFEFSSAHEDKFDALVQMLRETKEWDYVIGEIDIRLHRS